MIGHADPHADPQAHQRPLNHSLLTSSAPSAPLLHPQVRVLKDVNLNVVSAEVDTVGTEAQDEFFVTYRVRSWFCPHAQPRPSTHTAYGRD